MRGRGIYKILICVIAFSLIFSFSAFADQVDIAILNISEETAQEVTEEPTNASGSKSDANSAPQYLQEILDRIEKMHVLQNQPVIVIETPEPTVVPTIQPTQQSSAAEKEALFAEKLKKHYADYYFVVESGLRYLEYNIEDYNNAICRGSSSMVSYYRSGIASAILDIDVLMEKLGLYNDLNIWSLYYYLMDSPECGIYHDGLVKIKTAMDRLHYQTEHLGLWVPSTGYSESQMNKANCPQGFFTAPNGVCLSETGIKETKFWHSNGYPMICDYTGSCNETDIYPLDRCDWLDCD